MASDISGPVRPARADAVWLWAGTALAFSPALAELIGHWRAEAWSRPSLLALYFLLRTARALPAAPPHRSLGLGILVAGLFLEVMALAAGPPALGRLGLALGLVGMALQLGSPPLRIALIFFALIPVPFGVQSLFAPLLRPLLEVPAAGLANLFGAVTEATAEGLEARGDLLRLYASDLGFPLASCLAAAAWALGAHRGWAVTSTLAVAAGAAVAGLALQVLCLGAAGAVLAASGWEAARYVLDLAPLAVAALVGVGGFELGIGLRRGAALARRELQPARPAP